MTIILHEKFAPYIVDKSLPPEQESACFEAWLDSIKKAGIVASNSQVMHAGRHYTNVFETFSFVVDSALNLMCLVDIISLNICLVAMAALLGPPNGFLPHGLLPG